MTLAALAAVGNCGKTTIARHVLAPATGGAMSTLETHSASGEETDVLDRDGLAARVFAAPAGHVILDVAVEDTADALAALALVARQDTSLSAPAEARRAAARRWKVRRRPALSARAAPRRAPPLGESGVESRAR